MFLFFKQKTAYEMRISDWSSDVCSSDLAMVLAAVVLLIAVQMPGEDEPPVPTARVDDVRRLGDQFHVVVDVTNTGDQTAANVQITGELNIRDRKSTRLNSSH